MPNISNAELIELIKAGVNVKENYEQLYNQNRGFMYQVIRNRAHGVIEIDDLMQQSYIALVKAVEYYNPELEETNFLQLLKYCIWNEVRGTDLPAHMIGKIVKYKKTINELESVFNGKPSDEMIASEMRIGLKELDMIKFAYRMRHKLSLDAPIGEEGDTTRMDLYAGSQADEESDYEACEEEIDRQLLRQTLCEAVDKLSEDKKEVVNKKYFENLTLADIGKEKGVSGERIRQIESKAIRLLRRDRELSKKVEDWIDAYHPVGVSAFSRTGTSSTEWVVLERERRLEWEKERIEFENRLKEWKLQHGID